MLLASAELEQVPSEVTEIDETVTVLPGKGEGVCATEPLA